MMNVFMTMEQQLLKNKQGVNMKEKIITLELIKKVCDSIDFDLEDVSYEQAIGKPYVLTYDILKEIGLKTNEHGEVIYA